MTETVETLAKRIRTVRSLQSLVHTSRSLAAVNIRQYEDVVRTVHDSQHIVALGIRSIAPWLKINLQDSAPVSSRKVLIAVGAERGLCGRYSDKLADAAQRFQSEYSPDDTELAPVIVIGSKLIDIFRERRMKYASSLALPGSTHGLAETIDKLLEDMDAQRRGLDFMTIEVLFMGREKEDILSLKKRQIWPADEAGLQEIMAQPWESRMLPDGYGDKKKILSALMRQTLVLDLTEALLEAIIAENMFRLSTLQSAETNISEHLSELEQRGHRNRQNAITAELMESFAVFQGNRNRN